MLGGIFLLVVLWFLFALGTIDKSDKFWSYELIGPTIWVAVMGVSALLGSSSTLSDTSFKDVLLWLLSLSVGLTVVVARRNEFDKKHSAIAAGITHLLMGFGFTVLVMGVARWLGI